MVEREVLERRLRDALRREARRSGQGVGVPRFDPLRGRLGGRRGVVSRRRLVVGGLAVGAALAGGVAVAVLAAPAPSQVVRTSVPAGGVAGVSAAGGATGVTGVGPPPPGTPDVARPIDFGLARFVIPAGWWTQSLGASSGNSVLLIGPPGTRVLVQAESAGPQPRTVAVGRWHGYVVERTTTPIPPAGGFPWWPNHQAILGTYLLPALHLRLTVSDPAALRVAQSVHASALSSLLAMNRPQTVPASWRAVTYGNLQLEVPASWQVAQTHPGWPSLADACEQAMLRPKGSSPFTGTAPGCHQSWRQTGDVNQPQSGLWLESRGHSSSAAVTSEPLQKTVHLGAVTVTYDYSYDLWPSLGVVIRTPGQTVDARLALGPDPTVAEAIISSLRARPHQGA